MRLGSASSVPVSQRSARLWRAPNWVLGSRSPKREMDLRRLETRLGLPPSEWSRSLSSSVKGSFASLSDMMLPVQPISDRGSGGTKSIIRVFNCEMDAEQRSRSVECQFVHSTIAEMPSPSFSRPSAWPRSAAWPQTRIRTFAANGHVRLFGPINVRKTVRNHVIARSPCCV